MGNRISCCVCHGIVAILLASTVPDLCETRAAGAAPASEDAKGAWPGGSDRYDFVMDRQTLAVRPRAPADGTSGGEGLARCVLVVPKKASPGNPW
jgi:hypothetical protein